MTQQTTIDYLVSQGFTKLNEKVYTKDLKYNHEASYYLRFPRIITFSKPIDIGKFSTVIDVEFSFSTEKELSFLLNNFLQFDTQLVNEN